MLLLRVGACKPEGLGCSVPVLLRGLSCLYSLVPTLVGADCGWRHSQCCQMGLSNTALQNALPLVLAKTTGSLTMRRPVEKEHQTVGQLQGGKTCTACWVHMRVTTPASTVKNDC